LSAFDRLDDGTSRGQHDELSEPRNDLRMGIRNRDAGST